MTTTLTLAEETCGGSHGCSRLALITARYFVRMRPNCSSHLRHGARMMPLSVVGMQSGPAAAPVTGALCGGTTDPRNPRTKGDAMRITRLVFSSILAAALVAMPCIGMAAKGGGSPGSGIRVEQLPMPANVAQAMAFDINEHGTAIVGSMDWKDQYIGRMSAARWRRASAGSPWQAEDLRPLLPTVRSSSASLVNNAGTVVVHSEFDNGTIHRFVITSAGDTVETAPNDEPRDLSEMDAMVGRRWGGGVSPDRPIYWTSPYDVAVELPVLEDGYGGMATSFLGSDVLGVLSDASGLWLVRWRLSNGQWDVTRIVGLPPGYTFQSMNSGGRISLNVCDPYPCISPSAAAVWDPPYLSPPIYLVKRGGTSSGAGKVLEDGTVLGTLISSSNSMPVLWTTPDALTEFPTLSHADSSTITAANEFKQVVGRVRLYSARQFQTVAALWTLP